MLQFILLPLVALAGIASGGVWDGALASVTSLTRLYLLRVRYLLQQRGRPPLLAEEVRLFGRVDDEWLIHDQALNLLLHAQPDANVPIEMKKASALKALHDFDTQAQGIRELLQGRAEELAGHHRRLRRAAGQGERTLEMNLQWPVDLLGLLVLAPAGGAR